MQKQMLSLMGFFTLAFHVSAMVPTNGLPTLLRSGDYEVQVSPVRAWTPFSISYKGTKVGLDNGYYGTVIRKSPTIFTGSGHTEGGAEEVSNLLVVVDGVSQGEPVPGATYAGASVSLTKLSRLDQCDERWVLEVSPDGIHEAVELTAVEKQSMIGMYAFMHPLFTKTTEWLAANDSASYAGDCLSDGDWELKEDIRWVALYSPDQQLGVHISYPEVYSGTDKKTGIWDLSKYHKVYFQPFGSTTFAPGTTHAWEMDFTCFESAPSNWKEKARALSPSVEPAGRISGPVEASEDRTVDTAYCFGPGDETLLIRGKAGANYSRKIWIRFNLAGRQILADQPATFEITYLASAYRGKVFVFGLNSGFTPPTGVLDAGWLEPAVVWENAPGNASTHPYSFLSTATRIADLQTRSSELVEGQVLAFTVSKLSDFIQEDGSVTIMLSSYDNGIGTVCKFASSEHPIYAGPVLTPTWPRSGDALTQ